jgi:hypothetical protein
MYGNVRAYEGCALFRESIAKHAKFRKWYENMKKETIRGYHRHDKNFLFYLQSLEDELEDEKSTKAIDEILPNNLKTTSIQNKSEATQTENFNSSSSSLVAVNNKNSELSQITLFRVLTLNYMINLVAFAFAGYMGK